MNARACGVQIQGGRLLLQRKRGETIWALPGGKIEAGETPEAALIREFQEEAGVAPIIRETLWLIENCFEHGGLNVVQKEHYFAVDGVPITTVCLDETLEFRWVSGAELEQMDFRPSAIKMKLQKFFTGL